jgi:hypothetical protein
MSEISEIERNLEQAKEDLNRALDDVSRKVTSTGCELLLPEHEIRRHPIASLCGALALGLAAGGVRAPAVALGILAIGGALIVPGDSVVAPAAELS